MKLQDHPLWPTICEWIKAKSITNLSLLLLKDRSSGMWIVRISVHRWAMRMPRVCFGKTIKKLQRSESFGRRPI